MVFVGLLGLGYVRRSAQLVNCFHMKAEDAVTVDKGLVGLVWIVGLGAIAVTASLIIFDLLRPRIPDVFDRRRHVLPENVLGFLVDDGRHDTPDAPSLRPFAWVRHTLKISDLDIMLTHGLDTVMLLRFYRTIAQLTGVLSIFVTLVLLPTYGTASNKDLPRSNPLRVIGIRILSMANVPARNWRHKLVFVSDIIISVLVLRKMAFEVSFLASLRQEYRTSEHPSNYALIVQDIPEAIVSNEQLHRFWYSLFPDTLDSVRFIPSAARLERYRQEYWKAVRNRQRANALLESKTPSRELFKKMIDPFDALKEPKALWTSEEEQPGLSSTERHHAKSETSPEAECCGSSVPATDTENPGGLNNKSTAWQYHVPNQYFSDGQIRQMAGMLGSLDPIQNWVNPRSSAIYWERKEKDAKNRLNTHLQDLSAFEESHRTRAAIVVMRSKQDAAMIAQTNFSQTKTEWSIMHAPDVGAINWDMFKILARTILARKILSAALTTTLILFWVIPTAVIQSLANIRELSKKPAFSWLRFVNNVGPELSGFFEGLLPALVLELVMIIVPKLIRRIVMIKRIPSQVDVEKQVLENMIAFLYFSHLIYVVLSGSILKYYDQIISNPSSIVRILATSIPQQGTFMMTVVLLSAVVQVPISILQPLRLIRRWFGIRRALTPRDRELVNNNDSVTDHFHQYAIGTIYTVLGIVYSTLSPILLLFVSLFFFISYAVERFKLIYTHTKAWEGFAALHYTALQGVSVGLVVKHVTMAGLMGLNGHATLATLEFVSATIICTIIVWYRGRMAPILEHGALADLADVESSRMLRRGRSGGSSSSRATSFEVAKEAYQHPALAPLPELDTAV